MKKQSKGLDEAFKDAIKTYFEEFAIVKPEFAIHRLPRKIDVLIIEAEKPIKDHVIIFTYFQKYNILDFKSEDDTFVMEDIYKIGYYSNALLLREKKIDYFKNLTYTLVCTDRPNLIFKIAKPEIEKKGLYVVKGLCIIDVRVLVISEIEDDLEKEIKYLKIFAGKKERKDFIKWVLENESEDYILTQVILLYGDEVMKVAKEKGIKLRGLEKRAEEMAEVFGLKSKFFDEGSKFGYEQGAKTGYEQGTKIGLSKGQSRGQRKIELKTAINMIQFGMEKETILKVISISEKKLDWLIKRLNK